MAGWQRQTALVRAVNAMMRALGGASVTLRVPAASDGGTQRELGIAAATYENVELAPVIVRNLKERNGRQQIEVLISSSAIDSVMPEFGATKEWDFLHQAQQIMYGDLVFAITDVSAERFAGVEYMYRLTGVAGK